jgi:hypothetical protein
MHSGNFSIAAELYAEAGGFDPEFFQRSGEDYEFGIRLLAMGVPFVLATEAVADHHDATDLRRSLVRVRMEGRADVLIGLRHPDLRAGTGLGRFRSPGSGLIRLLRNLAFHRPRIGDGVARLLLACMGPLEQLRLRRSWRNVHGAVRSYWYCRGVAEELRASAGNATLAAFLDQVPSREEPVLDLDLAQGMTASTLMVDRLRPRGVRVSLAGIHVGTLAPLPGAEPVRGDHLTAFLAGEHSYQLLQALSAQRIRAGSEGPAA